GEETTATCGVCGYTTRGRYPHPLGPLPFLDRLGFIVPVGAIAALLIAFVGLIAVAVATAPPPPPPTAEHGARDRLEKHLALGNAYGEGDGASVIANAVLESLGKDQGFKKSDIGVAVQVTGDASRKVFVVCQYEGLRDLRPKARRDLVTDLRDAIVP